MILPLELVETILQLLVTDYIEDDDFHRVPAALKACSLASKSFVPFTRQHIFGQSRSIDFLDHPIPDTNRQLRTKLFNQILDECPEIECYIRHFPYRIEPSDFSDVEIQRLLRRLSNTTLESLTLHQINGVQHSDWISMPPDHLSLLLTLIRLPTLTSLSLSHFAKFPMPLLVPLTQLEKITINDIVFDIAEIVTTVTPALTCQKSRLRELIIYDCDHRIVRMLFIGTPNSLPAFATGAIRIFETNLVGAGKVDAIDNINAIFRAASQSLTSVSVLNVSTPLSGLKFDELQNVRTLNIDFEVRGSREDSLYSLAQILAKDGRSLANLSSIEIDLNMMDNDPPEHGRLDPLTSLDSTLNNKLFPRLVSVTFLITVFHNSTETTEGEYLALRASHFPLLSKPNATIKFNFSVEVLPYYWDYATY